MDHTSPTPLPVPEQLAKKILTDLQLTGISTTRQAELLIRITELTEDAILTAIFARLTESQMTHFTQQFPLDEDNPALSPQALEYLATVIPNLPDVIEDTLISVYDRLMDSNTILQHPNP